MLDPKIKITKLPPGPRPGNKKVYIPEKLTYESEIEKPVRFLKGVGEKLAQLLARKGIQKVRDVLSYYPRDYEDRREVKEIQSLKAGERTSVMGIVRTSQPVFFSKSHRRAFEVLVEDPKVRLENGSSALSRLLKLTWFHAYQGLKERFQKDTLVLATGEVQDFRGQIQMVHPDIEILGKWSPELMQTEAFLGRGILPIYSETEGLYQKTIRKIVQGTVREYSRLLEDPVPAELLQKYEFESIADALKAIHLPKEDADVLQLREGTSRSHERLIYEEFFELSISMALRKRLFTVREGIEFKKPEKFWLQLKENLPFQFTNAQKRVLQEILTDMSSKKVMHRLVQGDVGSGKTAVAAAAALIALEANYQVAFMAPTEVLVEQHFRNVKKMFAGIPVQIEILTGSSTASERKRLLEALKNPEKPIFIFGTHALLEPVVQFQKLGLVVVDEQHRFGVRQRTLLIEKGNPPPDVLVMTATPIPRTLSLTVYGDLDLSVIDEMPKGRKPIATQVFVEKEREKLEKALVSELEKGRQAYIILPLIEESEKLDLKSIEEMFPHYEERLKGFQTTFLHGKLKPADKLKILDDFREGKIKVLVSTTVIEVGVDVPNASVMVIEHAERFGLSQLHQLRGRVGRGEHSSYCFLLASHLGTAEIVKRLRTMEKVHDGFKLSEIDLEIRGPGEFLGTRQSGVPLFELARLPRDYELLKKAKQDAEDWVDKDPELEKIPAMKRRLARRAEEVGLN